MVCSFSGLLGLVVLEFTFMYTEHHIGYKPEMFIGYYVIFR